MLCLKVGLDPPDVIKIQPCAQLECWIDPSSVSPQKASELISASLQKQYELWQPRARYKLNLDPTVEDVKKLCTSLRRNAKEERVLFHYNGHGVPRPTANGEIWVFNRVSYHIVFNWRLCGKYNVLWLLQSIFRTTRNIFRCRFMISRRGWVPPQFTFTIVQMRASLSSGLINSPNSMSANWNKSRPTQKTLKQMHHPR